MLTKDLSEFLRSKTDSQKVVVIQGLGFVGSAMAVCLASLPSDQYLVIGLDLDNPVGNERINFINAGKFPFPVNDAKLLSALDIAYRRNSLIATSDQSCFSHADIIIVDIHLDAHIENNSIEVNIAAFKQAIESIARSITEDTLLVIETTVPPGTTSNIVKPIIFKAAQERGIDTDRIYIAHSYERVMPGKNYLDSMINFFRCYAGINAASEQQVKAFLESYINTDNFPLTRLASTTESETAKILENSYRALNIAFMQEWTEFAHIAGIDLFNIVDAIRMRPTHNNIMQPGFGVGGYCLTKDGLLGIWALRNFFSSQNKLEFTSRSLEINREMPNFTFNKLLNFFRDLDSRTIALFGITYLPGVGDTRSSPSEIFYDLCKKHNAKILLHDPILSWWSEKSICVETNILNLTSLDTEAVVFAVRHAEYSDIKPAFLKSMFPNLKLIIDANRVFSPNFGEECLKERISFIAVGRGNTTRTHHD